MSMAQLPPGSEPRPTWPMARVVLATAERGQFPAIMLAVLICGTVRGFTAQTIMSMMGEAGGFVLLWELVRYRRARRSTDW